MDHEELVYFGEKIREEKDLQNLYFLLGMLDGKIGSLEEMEKD